MKSARKLESEILHEMMTPKSDDDHQSRDSVKQSDLRMRDFLDAETPAGSFHDLPFEDR